MLKVEVVTSMVDIKSGTSAKTGRPYSIREQECWIAFFGRDGKPNPHPTKVKLTLDEDQNPYEIGDYILDPASLYADRFGQLAIRARLRKVAQAAAPAQPAKAA